MESFELFLMLVNVRTPDLYGLICRVYFSSDVFIEVYIMWNARYFVSYFYLILKFLFFLYLKEPAERERRQITAASSHSFTRVAVTTVALPKTAIGHGAL